ncbi:hypothetical protein BY996DRAFT_6488460, partial [Phakopsora pachyrhizi]
MPHAPYPLPPTPQPPDPHQSNSYQGQFDNLTNSMDHKMDQLDVSSVELPLTQCSKAGKDQDSRPIEKRTDPGTLTMAVLEVLEMADSPKSNEEQKEIDTTTNTMKKKRRRILKEDEYRALHQDTISRFEIGDWNGRFEMLMVVAEAAAHPSPKREQERTSTPARTETPKPTGWNQTVDQYYNHEEYEEGRSVKLWKTLTPNPISSLEVKKLCLGLERAINKKQRDEDQIQAPRVIGWSLEVIGAISGWYGYGRWWMRNGALAQLGAVLAQSGDWSATVNASRGKFLLGLMKGMAKDTKRRGLLCSSRRQSETLGVGKDSRTDKEGFKGLEQDKDSTRITGQKSRGYRIKNRGAENSVVRIKNNKRGALV